MKSSSPAYQRLAIVMIVVGAVLLPRASTHSGAPPARSNHPIQEVEFARVVLSPDAEKRLAITTQPVQLTRARRARSFGASMIFPLRKPASPGTKFSETEYGTAFDLDPPDDDSEIIRWALLQLEADEKVDLAKVELEKAEIDLARAEEVLRRKAGSVRAVDDARASVKLAQAKLKNAQRQRAFRGPSLIGALNRKTLWVKVPVYAGDLPRLNTAVPAIMNELARLPGLETISLTPIQGPPTADPVAVTVDVYYLLESNERGFRPGQRVAVDIPLNEVEQNLTVPWSAILRDVHGGTWVYENTEPQTYERKRVILRRVVGDQAILDRGPAVGAKIVTAGAAELFGVELGFGK